MKQFSILLLMLFLVSGLKAQKTTSMPEGFELSSFMVRSSVYTSDLANRFRIPPSLIKKFNPQIKSIIFKGSVIKVPIKVRPTQWDPTKVNTNKPFLGPEDARPVEEFEWEKESIDPLLSEEVLSLNEIIGDSVQHIKISQHIKTIDNRIKYLKFQTDSVKRSEFSFDYDEKDMNALLKRLEQARNRHYESSPFGREQDSLTKLKSLLSDENNRLSRKLNEYEYLVENAYFFKKSKEGAKDLRSNRKVVSNEDRLNYERQYLIDNDGLLKKKETSTNNESVILSERLVDTPDDSIDIKPETFSNPKVNDSVDLVNSLESTTIIADTKDTLLTLDSKQGVQIEKSDLVSEKEMIENKAKGDEVEIKDIKEEVEYVLNEKENTNKESQEAKSKNSTNESKSVEGDLNLKKEVVASVKDIAIKSTEDTKSAVKPIESKIDEEPKSSVKSSETKISEDLKSASKPVVTKAQEKSNTKSVNSKQNDVVELKEKKSVTVAQDISKDSISLSDNVSPEKDMVDLNELPQTSPSIIKTTDNPSTLFYAKKIVKEQQLNLDDVDNLILSEKLIIPQFSIKPIKVEYVKGKPFYSIAVDSISKMKSMGFLNRFKANILLDEQKQAIENLEKSIKIDPQNVKSWVYHADLLMLSQRQLDAMIEYQIATEIDPNNSALFFKIGSLYEKTNNIGKAYEFYSKAISADSFYSNAYFARAKLSVDQGEIKEAIRDYSDLLQLLPTIENAYKERGHLRLKERDYEGALWDYNEYFKIANPDADVYYKRGICKLFTGKIVDGCEDFKVAKKLNFYDAEKALKKYCE